MEMTQTIESLQSRIAELEAENARLKKVTHVSLPTNTMEQWVASEIRRATSHIKEQLAASQLRETQLRDALRDTYIELFHCDQQMTHTYDEDGEPMWHTGSTVTMALEGAKELLDNPTDTIALDAYVEGKVNKIESCRDWYKRRIDLLQEWQSKMRDPERTIVCDIIANGLTMPEGGRYEIGKSDLSTLTRQRDLAVEALKWLKLIFTDSEMSQERNPELWMPTVEEAIKESEVK
jgi:regulator of replication initiation timing